MPFSLTFWNAGWLIAGGLVLSMVIAPRLAGRDSGLAVLPPYTPHEQIWLRLQLLDLLALLVVSVFTPLADRAEWIAAGAAIWVVGAAIYVAALRAFGRTPAGELVTGGVFQLNRNPIYTAQTLILLSAGIAGASVLLIALSAGFALLVDRLVRAEERMCVEAFGDAYRAYAAKVPRWIGGWRD
jgi:protein-S-isoprenylcysteine O-methyltransferase Ste14